MPLKRYFIALLQNPFLKFFEKQNSFAKKKHRNKNIFVVFVSKLVNLQVLRHFVTSYLYVFTLKIIGLVCF